MTHATAGMGAHRSPGAAVAAGTGRIRQGSYVVARCRVTSTGRRRSTERVPITVPTGTEETAGAEKVQSALAEFETRFFATMVLALGRPFVHRFPMVTGKDSNPLNEVELICDSLMNNDGVMRGTNVIKYVPEQAVVGIIVDEPIRLTAEDFTRLSTAFFAELERRFVAPSAARPWPPGAGPAPRGRRRSVKLA
ncbi:MAG: hypothetical protein JWP46_1651 [Modestobacter sp.]|nr:hypothetical protein [Modestobacter sp.]